MSRWWSIFVALVLVQAVVALTFFAWPIFTSTLAVGTTRTIAAASKPVADQLTLFPHMFFLTPTLPETHYTNFRLNGTLYNATSVIVSAVVTNRYDGPILAIHLGVPCWSKSVGDIWVNSTTRLILDGDLSFAFVNSTKFFCVRLDGEYRDSDVYLLHKLPREIFAGVEVSAELSFDLDMSASTVAGSDIVHTASFRSVPIALPLGLGWREYGRLVMRNVSDYQFLPEMDVCYGPIYSAGMNPIAFAEYVGELIQEQHGAGARHLVFYIDLATLDEEGSGQAMRNLINLYKTSPEIVTFIDTSVLNAIVHGWYKNQRTVINDCLRRVSGEFRFVYVGDIDELVLPLSALTLGEAFQELIENPWLLDGTAQTIPSNNSYIWINGVCERTHVDQTLDAASVIRNRQQHVRQFQIPTYFTTTNQKQKRISMTAFVTVATEHLSWAIMDRLPLLNQQRRQAVKDTNRSSVSVSETKTPTYGILRLHMRMLPYQVYEPCWIWGDQWLTNYSTPGGASWEHRIHYRIPLYR